MFTVAVCHFYKLSTSYTVLGVQNPTGKALKSAQTHGDWHVFVMPLLVVMLMPC